MSRAYTLAVQLLSRREHSRHELEKKLSQRSFDKDEIESTLERLKAQDLLSDARFSEQYVRMRRGRGYGPNRVMMELKERGIDAAMAADFVESENEHWFMAAKMAWQKKFGDVVESEFNILNKQKRFMYYRGYAQSMIEQVIMSLKG